MEYLAGKKVVEKRPGGIASFLESAKVEKTIIIVTHDSEVAG